MIRGFVRSRTKELGNFWHDLVRTVVYILLPLARSSARSCSIAQGVPQTFASSAAVHGIQGFAQTIARGPVASQIAIKQLGTNGGGFFNVNSAHPFEGGTPLGELHRAAVHPADPRRPSPTRSARWSATSARAGRSSRP